MTKHFRAQDYETTERLGAALEEVDERLGDAESERSSAEDDVQSAKDELDRAVKELEQKTADEKRLQEEWLRAAEAYNQAYDDVPEGEDVYDAALRSEFAEAY